MDVIIFRKIIFVDQKFITQMMQLGILSHREQETLWSIAQRCARTAGVPLAGAGAVMGLKAGSVVVPGLGTLAGPVAGALAGLFAGTFACTTANIALREELKKLARMQ